MKAAKKPKGLSASDKHLWDKVKKTITPLSEQKANLMTEFEAALSRPASDQKKIAGKIKPDLKKKAASGKPAILKPYSPETARQAPGPGTLGQALALDEKTWRKIGKGKVAIDRRLDLHGMTQVQAHSRLFMVLEEAYRLNQRVVLVITGKGSGILKEAVPRWLQEPAFKALVTGFRLAHISHGGEGALYVRVRRKKP